LGESFKINAETGNSIKIDGSGFNIKSYHMGVTGFASPMKRTQFGRLIGDQAMIPEIPKKIKMWQPDLTK